jgi:hypothetical protein
VGELVDRIVAMALEQADEIATLGAPRAEAWASDLLAMARESLGRDGPRRVVDALATVGGDRAATTLFAVAAITEGLVDGIDPSEIGEAPEWAPAAGTARCTEVLELRRRRDRSMAFRFVDEAADEHVMVVDLVQGPPERVGEVLVAPGDVFEAMREEDADIDADPVDVRDAARRVAQALSATDRPRPTAIVNGQLLVARLKALTGLGLEPPEPVREPVPPPPVLDPDDARFALDLLDRALSGVTVHLGDVEPSLAVAAETLRAGAEADEPVAVWLAAADPFELDGPDEDLVVAALAATISPRRLDPLDADQREAASMLEWADWLGAVIELCRDGVGSRVDAPSLVDRVNRCPEVTTAIPARDRPRIEWAFAVMIDAWMALGAVDSDGLTELGLALMPLAVHLAWAPRDSDRP